MSLKSPFSRFIVQDHSMEPSYLEGDHVLTFNWGKLGVGEVIVFKLKGVLLIKRIDRIQGEYFYVSGDNKEKSSRIGSVKKEQIVGKVILKY